MVQSAIEFFQILRRIVFVFEFLLITIFLVFNFLDKKIYMTTDFKINIFNREKPSCKLNNTLTI